MSLKYGILGLLNYDSMTGYDLHKVFQESLNFFWQAQVSQIYRELNTMEREGWLTSEYKIQTDKPNKKLYTITESGRQALQSWLRQGNLEDAMSVHSSFLMGIFFSGERPDEENKELLREFIHLCEEALAKMDKADVSVRNYNAGTRKPKQALYWGLTVSFGRRYYETCLCWARDAIRTIEEGK